MAIVDGDFWIDKRGEKMHKSMITPDKQLKDELVEKLVLRAKEVQAVLADFKKEAAEEIDAYFELLLQKYGMDAKKGSKKGNFTLENFSGTAEIKVAVNDTISFDEKLNIAKAKIDECLHELTKNASAEIKTLITKAFEVDKKGNVNAKKILALKSYDISHPLWIEAMAIIDESIEIVSSKSYIRFYEREDITKPYVQISLDFAKA